MHRSARALAVALVLVAACGSNDGGTTTTLPEAAATTVAPGDTSPQATEGMPGDTEAPPATDETGATVTQSDDGATTTTTSGPTTSTTAPPPPTTKPTSTIPTQGSSPVTDDSTPGSGTRPADAEEVTITSSQLFVIGGDTLYLVVEGAKPDTCYRLQYDVVASGGEIEIDLYSVADASFCTPSDDYKDSLALGVYGSGSYEIILNGNPVADVEL